MFQINLITKHGFNKLIIIKIAHENITIVRLMHNTNCVTTLTILV